MKTFNRSAFWRRTWHKLVRNKTSSTQVQSTAIRTLSGDKLLQKISEVWGINYSLLAPIELQGAPGGEYYRDTHKIIYMPGKSSIRNHELIHAADVIVSPGEKLKNFNDRNSLRGILKLGWNALGGSPKLLQYRKAEEAIANLGSQNRPKSTYVQGRNMNVIAGVSAATIGLVSPKLGVLMGASLIGKNIDHRLFVKKIAQVFDRYGEGGILLFLVHPPRGVGPIGGIGSAETAIWEKLMVRKGFLLPLNSDGRGGLTASGKDFLRAKLSGKEIVRRLQEAKKNRLAQVKE